MERFCALGFPIVSDIERRTPVCLTEVAYGIEDGPRLIGLVHIYARSKKGLDGIKGHNRGGIPYELLLEQEEVLQRHGADVAGFGIPLAFHNVHTAGIAAID